MADKPMKIPGPDHAISIDANPSRVVVKVGGKIIADTSNALTLREASYPPVQYIPRRDGDMTALTRSEHTTYAPTRATLPTTAFRLAGIVPSMRCGLMRPPLKRWRRSRITSPFTPIASTRSKNGQRPERSLRRAFRDVAAGRRLLELVADPTAAWTRSLSCPVS